jgi:pimeloyl-ACP methyl ester carboxylesterase
MTTLLRRVLPFLVLMSLVITNIPVAVRATAAAGSPPAPMRMAQADRAPDPRLNLSASLDVFGPTLANAPSQPLVPARSRTLGQVAGSSVLNTLSAPPTEGPWDRDFSLLGVNGPVYALAISGTAVLVGGKFTTAGGVPANNIAQYDTITGVWSALGNSVVGGGVQGHETTSGSILGGEVHSITVDGNIVYVGGHFYKADGVAAFSIATWNASTDIWAPLGDGFDRYVVDAIAVQSTVVYIIAHSPFASIPDLGPRTFASWWNGVKWSANCCLTGGGFPWLGGYFRALARGDSYLYFGGSFNSIVYNVTSSLAAPGLARWNGATWSALDPGGPANHITALTFSHGDLYVAGNLVAGDPGTSQGIMKWNEASRSWSVIASTITAPLVTQPRITALTVRGNQLYAAGDFDSIDGVPAKNIAMWNALTNTWSALDAGVIQEDPDFAPYQTVQALAINDEHLYVGGYFTTVDDEPANYLTRWKASATLIVNTEKTDIDGVISDIGSLKDNPGGDGKISLPEAIAAVNNTGPESRISFDLPPNTTIVLTSTLSLNVPNTTIDGDVDRDGVPDVVVASYPVTNTLAIRSSNNTIRYLAIKGLRLEGAEAAFNTVHDSYIGIDADENQLSPLLQDGNGLEITAGASNNVIRKNVFAGNTGNDPDNPRAGLLIADGAHDNDVQGNRFGINLAGQIQPNDIGIAIVGGAPSNRIGGQRFTTDCQDPCNLISGNLLAGIMIEGASTANNSVRGNLIGLDSTGAVAAPNEGPGILIASGAAANTIGGERDTPTCDGTCNVISGNNAEGIAIEGVGTSLNRVEGNFIGISLTGSNAVPNNLAGITVRAGASSNAIGAQRSALDCRGPCNVISGNNQDGVMLLGGGTNANTVHGNLIGVNPTGTTALPNGAAGVFVGNGAAGNDIGGSHSTTACSGLCNVISGNSAQGIVVAHTGTTFNTVAGNFVGVNLAGTAAIPNELAGISVQSGAAQNLIGGARSGPGCDGSCNIISGNRGEGVLLTDAGTAQNAVQGNLIGVIFVDFVTQPVPNALSGISIESGAAQNQIGGLRGPYTCHGSCNVISGNVAHGVSLRGVGTNNNIVQGNYIGVDVWGSTALPNQRVGVNLSQGASENQIGGERLGQSCEGPCNLIGGNRGAGVLLQDDGTTRNAIQGNFIGTGANEVLLPNEQSGIIADGATTNLIGGERAAGACIGTCNLIRGNLGAGVWVAGLSRGITIRGNQIVENDRQAIDLGGRFEPGAQSGDKVTLNDAGDKDNGPNTLLNAPLSLAADFDGTQAEISGVFSSGTVETTTVKIDIYGGNDAAINPGEARYYLGTTTPQDDGTFSLIVEESESSYPTYSATATDSAGNTSELSLKTPVIFLPGAAASVLVDRAHGNEELWLGLKGCLLEFNIFEGCDGFRRRLSLRAADVAGSNIVATDAMRYVLPPSVPVLGQLQNNAIYGPLLEGLVNQGHYHEYQVSGDPNLRTKGGCDYDRQKAAIPNLFVFGYDWRKDITTTVTLLRDYMDCVQKFYPGGRVNIVTHSMGSLLARRYILDHPADHHVQRLITLAAPWIGAPKFIYVLETGNFLPLIASGSGIKHAVESMPGAHELLPSRSWFTDWALPPLVEVGADFDGKGSSYDVFNDYDTLMRVLDEKYPDSKPGTTSQKFHSDEQDFVTPDDTGVRYFHLYGTQQRLDTIEQVGVRLSCSLEPGPNSCITKQAFKLKLGIGDGTVPTRSLSPWGFGTYQTNDPIPRQVFEFSSPGYDDDAYYSHTLFPDNPCVYLKVLDLLRHSRPPAPPVCRGEPPPEGLSALAMPATNATSVASAQPIFYNLTIDGATHVVIDDGVNSTAPISGTDILGSVPGVSHYTLGERINQYILPAMIDSNTVSPPPDPVYQVTFHTTDEPLALELVYGTQSAVSQVVRYQDLTLPQGVTATLTLKMDGPSSLSYDTDGDGDFETIVQPTITATGAGANDLDAPEITITPTDVHSPTLTITITAQDSGSGLQRLYYSLDGTNYQPYAGSFQANMVATPTLYVLADDNLANRRVIAYRVPTAADTTAPAITPTITGTPGTNGWYTSDVTVTWNVNDSESGITISSACDETALTIETTGTMLTCSATNGAGLSHSVSVTVKIDKLEPTISIISPQAASYNYPRTVNITWTANDALAGIASTSATLDGAVVANNQVLDLFILPAGAHTLVVTATDAAGNTASTSVTFINSTKRVYLPLVRRNL